MVRILSQVNIVCTLWAYFLFYPIYVWVFFPLGFPTKMLKAFTLAHPNTDHNTECGFIS